MQPRRLVSVCMLILFAFPPLRQPPAPAPPHWEVQTSNTSASLRGISAVSATVAWASGTGGAFLRTTDGGEHWQARVVPGAEQLDFRDIEGFDADTAILLAAGPGEKSAVYKTTDGGHSWKLALQNRDPKGFWDCMAWWDRQHGIFVGDPVDGRFQLMTTSDGGQNWSSHGADALSGEGAFAASGTCIAVGPPNRAWIATGGAAAARVLRTDDGGQSWSAAGTPLAAGAAAAGVFSVAFTNGSRGASEGIAVGGVYDKPALAEKNVAITQDGGKTWTAITGAAPHGYRSAVSSIPGKTLAVAVGTNGSDVSRDGGNSWQPVDHEDYNAVSFSKEGVGWAVGAKGRIAKWAK